MKKYCGSRGIAPCILNLGIRWGWVVSFTPRPLYPQGNSPWYTLDRSLGRPQSRSWRGGEEKQIPSLPLPGIEYRLSIPELSHYTAWAILVVFPAAFIELGPVTEPRFVVMTLNSPLWDWLYLVNCSLPLHGHTCYNTPDAGRIHRCSNSTVFYDCLTTYFKSSILILSLWCADLCCFTENVIITFLGYCKIGLLWYL